MKKYCNPTANLDILRQKAEKFLENKTNSSDTELSEGDIRKLLHELNVQQIELEMQNEELRAALARESELVANQHAELYDNSGQKRAEIALRESEERLRNITENAPNLLIEVNRQGQILFMNNATSGYRLEEVIGKNVSELSPLSDYDEINEVLNLVFSKGLPQTFQSRGLGENSEMKWYQSNISPVIKSEVVTSAIIIVNDITDLERAEERRLTILNTAMDGFTMLNIDGNILEVNDTYCQMTGYNKKELLHKQISELVVAEPKDKTNVRLQKIMEQGEDRFETQHRRKDGSILDLEISLQYQPIDGGQFIAFMHDITERKLIEQVLKENEQKFRNYVDFAPHGIFVANEFGDYIDVNPAAAKITGYTKKELLSMKLTELVPEESKKSAADHFSRVVKEGFASGEYAFIRKNKSKGYWLVDAVKLSDHSFLGFVNDITRNKEFELTLHQSEDLLKSVMELLPVGVWIFNEKGEITSGNAEARNIWAGIKYIGIDDYSEYKGWWLNSGKLIEPQEWSSARAIQKGETSIDEEIEIECFDGTHKIILNSAMPLFNSDGSVRGAIATNHDITARKKTEEALNQLNQELENRVNERTDDLVKANTFLKQAEEKYRTVADHTYGWEFWTNQNGDFLYCSPSCERITGYKASEFLQNPGLFQQIVHQEDLSHFQCHKQKEDKGRDGNHEINYRIVSKDGSVKWIGHVCQPIFNEKGILIGTRGSNRDITVRKNIEQLLKTSNQKYKLLSENITDGIFLCRDGCFEYVNKAMNQIFGYDDQELIGRKLTQLVLPDYLDELEILHKVKISADRILNIEIECFRKDISTISVEFLMNYIGSERVIYGVVHDITEKKQLQKNIVKAIIKTEEKERAYFSKELHDGLGPLLSTIKLYLQWSERPNTNARREEIVHQAEGIIEDALTTVKEISNKLSPHLLTNHGLSSAIQSFAGKVEQSSNIRIDFESDLKRRLDDEIEAAIYRATIECINNSIKHAKASNISILINDADSQLLMHYHDDGIGFNLEETLAKKKGLGLFNLQNRIQTIGGKITLFSKPGQGVDYQITINL